MPRKQVKAPVRKENKTTTDKKQSSAPKVSFKETQILEEKSEKAKVSMTRRGRDVTTRSTRADKTNHLAGDVKKDEKSEVVKVANSDSIATTSIKAKHIPRSKSLLRSPYELRSAARLGRKRSKSEEIPPVSTKTTKVQKPVKPKTVSKGKANEAKPKEKLKRQNAQEPLPLPEQKLKRRRGKPLAATKTEDTRKDKEKVMEKVEEKEQSENIAPMESADAATSEALEPSQATSKTGRRAQVKGRKRTAPPKEEREEAEVVKKAKLLLEVPKLPTQEGVILTVGQGDTGQLGLGPDVMEKVRPAQVTLDDPIVSISAGGMHTVCLTNKGEVYTFGCNDEGALGRETEGKEESESSPGKAALPEKVVLISAGDSHTAAVTEAGHLFIWGNFRNSKGPMGLTTNGARKTPLQIMEDKVIVSIASGSDHIACLTKEGQVYTFGCGEQGQLGRLPEDVAKSTEKDKLGIFLNPAPVNFSEPGMGDSKGMDVEIDQIWCEPYATFARTSNGQIYCFGLNNYKQLGVSDKLVIYLPTLVTSFEGKLWQEIRGGQHHTLALDEQGHVYALGRKEYGRLGLGDDCEDKEVPTLIPTLESVKCTGISCGTAASFAVSEAGELYSWGMGTNGETGHGSQDDVMSPKLVKSKSLTEKIVLQVSGGGQHAVILAQQKQT